MAPLSTGQNGKKQLYFTEAECRDLFAAVKKKRGD